MYMSSWDGRCASCAFCHLRTPNAMPEVAERDHHSITCIMAGAAALLFVLSMRQLAAPEQGQQLAVGHVGGLAGLAAAAAAARAALPLLPETAVQVKALPAAHSNV